MKIKRINGGFNHYTSRRALIENGYIVITFGNEDELRVSFTEGCGAINIAFRWRYFKIHGSSYHAETRVVTYRNDTNVSDTDVIVYLAIMDELYENHISFPSKSKREMLINVIRSVTARLNMFIDAKDALFDYVVIYEDADKSTLKFKVMRKDAFSAVLQKCADLYNKAYVVRQALDVEKIINDFVECNPPDMIYTECIFDNNIVEKIDQIWKSREGFKAYIRDKLHSSYDTMDPLIEESYVTDDFLYRFMENPNLVTQLIQEEYAMKIIKGGAKTQ